jgi:HSP20 family protein
MNLVKRNSSTNSNSLFPSLIEELFKPDWMGGQNMNMGTPAVPPVNIRETDTSYEVELSAPGKKKEDFNIEIDNDLLTISSEFQKENSTEEEGKFTRREFSYSSFRRSFTLPETVKEDEINASYEHGILKINLPKREEALPKPKRSINIQ